MSLLARILLLVLFATLTPAVFLGLYLVEQRDGEIDEAKHNLGSLAKYAAENLDDKVRGTVQLLHGLSRAPDLDTADRTACSEFLAGVLGRYPQYTGLLTITPEGDLHCDSLRSGRKLNVSGRDYFRQVRTSLQPAFDVVIGGITGIAVLQVAYPVLDGQGTLKHVLLGSLNLSQYAQGFTSASHPGVRMLIWNRKGMLMARKPDAAEANLVGQGFAASELFRFAASGNAGMAAELPDLDGVFRVWALGILPEPRGGGARITLGIQRDVLVAQANKGLRDALAVLIAVSLLAFTGALYLAETGIRRHVRRIASVAGRVGAGDLSARIDAPYPRGELGELMAVVDRTAGAVQAQQAELESRSRDLQRVNRTLRVLSGINTLIVRVRDRDELFKEACRIAVEEGGFRMSWIGNVERSTMSVVPVASAGEDEELLTDIKGILSSSDNAPNSMAARAIRERNAAVSNDSQNDSRISIGKKYAESGVRSMAVLPLIVANEAVGALALYAGEIEFFHEEELKLLTELAGNIAFAIDHIEKAEKIARLSRIQAVTGGINALIVRVRDRQELFQESCRIAVEAGQFPFAWIGVLDPVTQDVTPVAWAGEHAATLTRSKSSARDDLPEGRGAVGRAIRARRTVFNNDIAAGGFGGPRRHEILRLGFQSQITLPLFEGKTVIGTLTMYATEADFFDQEELKLLEELAGDISFAVETIAGQQKLEKLSRIRAVSSEINTAIVHIRGREALLRETCRIVVEDGKFGMVWVAALDPAKQEVRPIAWEGFSAETAHAVNWTALSIRGVMLGEVIQTRRLVVRNDIEAALPMGILRREAEDKGYRSSVCLPFVIDDAVVAAAILFAAGGGFFDEEELALLSEVAGNISFALEHIEKADKIARLSRIQAVMSSINALIVRVRDRQELFDEACRIAVEHGGFGIAWIGMLDPLTLDVAPVAHAGLQANEHLAKFKSSASAEKPEGRGVVGRAIREGKAAFINDLLTEPGGSERRKEAISRGYRSRIALPLWADNGVAGVMVLFASERDFFNDEELKLLSELAGDISFALEHIGKGEKLDYLAYYDALTGLPNRTLLEDRLTRQLHIAREKGTKVALLLANVNRFRFINESLGRHAGDALLRELAARARKVWSDPDNVARISADTFGAIVADVNDETEMAHLPGQLMTEVARLPFKIENKELAITMSVGIAIFPTDGSDADALFRNAEAALKRAKASGERYLFYRSEMNARVAETLQLESKLRQALDREEFVLHYQPKVHLATGKLSGLEALIRWNDPDSGLVPPMKFIPLLEETGMILEAGAWAMRKAVADYQSWRTQGLEPPRVAVNVSPIQLRQENFVEVVRNVIGGAVDGSHGLDLEITESLIMEDIEANIQKLRAVRDMGVKIAIDDFGTGYSSLRYLAKLPVDALKIDRSFIITMTGSPDSMTIVSTVISLAHALNLKVIAEGVDAEDQRKFLKLLKCDEMQGYLFSRPVPKDDVCALLEVDSAVTA